MAGAMQQLPTTASTDQIWPLSELNKKARRKDRMAKSIIATKCNKTKVAENCFHTCAPVMLTPRAVPHL
jgi:hypothetical protein